MPFSLVLDNIVRIPADAVVNAANSRLLQGGGVCGAIFKAAGADRLQAACDKLAPVATGQAVITPGFDLPARSIIHTVGPVYDPAHAARCETLLYSCYRNSLALAEENGCRSVAFPLISSGIYGYPKDQALEVAVSAIRDFLADHEMKVMLVFYDRNTYRIANGLYGAVGEYLSGHLSVPLSPDLSENSAETGTDPGGFSRASMIALPGEPIQPAGNDGLKQKISDMDEPFNQILFRLIDAKGMSDTEVYKNANLDRRLYSKIRSGRHPSKRTVLALAIALRLDLAGTEDFLKAAGYALSRSQKADVIVEYFIQNGNYDIYQINEVLFAYDQPLLGGV